VIKELEHHEGAILFIDEIHTVIGAGATSGGAMDASNLLKPALAQAPCAAWFDHLQGIPPALREGPRPGSPVPEDRRQRADDRGHDQNPQGFEDLLRGISQAEVHHRGLKAAVELSAKYITDRKLPDKAIDVIDEAGASQMLLIESRRKKVIGLKEVEAVVAKIARIPPSRSPSPTPRRSSSWRPTSPAPSSARPKRSSSSPRP